MRSKCFALFVCMLAAMISLCPAQDPEIETGQAAFKTVHRFNLKPEFSVSDVQRIVDRFNAVFVQLGHPESQYRLWEITGELEGGVRYLWESNWSSKTVYDEIHMNAAFRRLLNEAFVELAKMFQDHTYSQYYELYANVADNTATKEPD